MAMTAQKQGEVILINETRLPIMELEGQRVITFRDIDRLHQRPDGTARKRFNDNRSHFIEGQDYFKVKCSWVRPYYGQTLPNGYNPNADLILITEIGYLMITKPMRDNLSWDVQRALVTRYFKHRQEPLEPTPGEIVQAAEIYKTCPADRLYTISRLLRQGGFQILEKSAAADAEEEEPLPYEVNEQWTADIKAQMHRLGITNAVLAAEASVTPTYLSLILNGRKNLSEHGRKEIRERIYTALGHLEEKAAHAIPRANLRGKLSPAEREQMKYEALKEYPQLILEHPEALEQHPDLKESVPQKSRAGCGKGFDYKKLNRLMNQNNITQKRLSEISGLHRTSISEYCRGLQKPGDANRSIICRALNVPETYFDK